MAERACEPRVMVDGFNLGLAKGTGIATYARNLCRAYRNLKFEVDVLYGLPRGNSTTDALAREIAFFDRAPESAWWADAMQFISALRPRFTGVKSFDIPMSGEVILDGHRSRLPEVDRIWNAPNLYRIAEIAFATRRAFTTVRHRAPVDVMHWTCPIPVRLPGARNIYTLHDLVPLRLPFTTLDSKEIYLRLVRRIAAQADHIVTVSETSRADILRILGCPEDKVTNTYQSVEVPEPLLTRSDDESREAVEGTFGLPYKGYFLYFGAIEPKKNVARLIEAYLASEVKEPLVIIGSLAWKTLEDLKALDLPTNKYMEQVDSRIITRERIRRFDYASYPLLVSTIRGAKATLFPSLYEGFGLPILESMLLGTPVLTSKIGATAEVAGDAAVLIDPYNTSEMVKAIRALSENGDLRTDLSVRGRQQAARFSPARHEERLSLLYDALMRQPTSKVVSRLPQN